MLFTGFRLLRLLSESLKCNIREYRFALIESGVALRSQSHLLGLGALQ
jgi:hypothetical protein